MILYPEIDVGQLTAVFNILENVWCHTQSLEVKTELNKAIKAVDRADKILRTQITMKPMPKRGSRGTNRRNVSK